MALVVTDNTHYTNIANAIREKNGESTLYTPSQMAEAIAALADASGPYAVKSGTAQSTDGTLEIYTGLQTVRVFVLYTTKSADLASGRISHVFSLRGTSGVFDAVSRHIAITMDADNTLWVLPEQQSLIQFPSPGGWKYRNYPSTSTPLDTTIEYGWIAAGEPVDTTSETDEETEI